MSSRALIHTKLISTPSSSQIGVKEKNLVNKKGKQVTLVILIVKLIYSFLKGIVRDLIKDCPISFSILTLMMKCNTETETSKSLIKKGVRGERGSVYIGWGLEID